jgi:transposase
MPITVIYPSITTPVKILFAGKKNWLFVGSERAGKRVAAIQSLLGSAKLNGLNPTQWLNETLEKLPTWPYSRIDELLPLSSDALQKLKH